MVSPLVPADGKDALCDRVLGIQSMGGGLFTCTPLVTAAKIVQESDKGTRHIVLFADAADAEEAGEYQRLLATLTSIGITVSVIALGSESDADAAFLKDVAERGGGRIHFTASADERPRLFAQEWLRAVRLPRLTWRRPRATPAPAGPRTEESAPVPARGDDLGDAGLNGGGEQVVNACDYGHRAGTATRSGLPAEARAAPKADFGTKPAPTAR